MSKKPSEITKHIVDQLTVGPCTADELKELFVSYPSRTVGGALSALMKSGKITKENGCYYINNQPATPQKGGFTPRHQLVFHHNSTTITPIDVADAFIALLEKVERLERSNEQLSQAFEKLYSKGREAKIFPDRKLEKEEL